jgi:aldehyde dehydrogenase (NAD+)
MAMLARSRVSCAARAVEPSGIGQYYGKDGFEMLAHAKSILISPPDVAIEHLFSPYTDRKNAALSRRFEY